MQIARANKFVVLAVFYTFLTLFTSSRVYSEELNSDELGINKLNDHQGEAGDKASQTEDADELFRKAALLINSPKLRKKGISLLEESAKLGNFRAAKYLGSLYYHGQFVDMDVVRGVNYWVQSARAGDVESSRWLGDHYASVEYQNCGEAEKWYYIGVSQSDWISINGLSWIYSSCINTDFRQISMAISLAQYAVEISSSASAYHSLAVAYLRNNEFVLAETAINSALSTEYLSSDKEKIYRKTKELIMQSIEKNKYKGHP